jgi:pimeloyl-ACP methyl ester carboxylesterase
VWAERLRRLSVKKRREATVLLMELRNAGSFARFAKLMVESDSYDALPADFKDIKMRPDLFRAVWKEAAELRRNGELLELGRRIRCPVIAVHGDFDPHPAAGVQKPLSGVLKDFRFVLLKHCGHAPWLEKQAREKFFMTLNGELN